MFHNIEIMIPPHLQTNEKPLVKKYQHYLMNTYINHIHFLPSRWLHLQSKEDYFYDATNNTSEILNHVLKMNIASSISLEQIARKLTHSIKKYDHICKNFHLYHKYSHSLERSRKNKEKRVSKKIEKQTKSDEYYPKLKKYSINK